ARTVHHDEGSAGDGGNDLGQDVERAAPVVELTAAVVRDVDALHAVLARRHRVLDGGDALEDEGQVGQILVALDVVPVEPGLIREAGRALPPRLDVAGGDVALAPAVRGRVDGEAEGRVSVIARALDVIVDPGVVAANVQLEDAEVVRGRRR